MNNISAASLRLSSSLSQATRREASNLKKLSTGKDFREGSASHALLLKASASLTSAARGLEQASVNISNSSSLSGVAEGGLSDILSNLQGLRDIAVQAADGSLSASDRQSLQTRANDITAQIDTTAGSLSFNGTTLLDGSFSKTVQVGANEGDTVGVSLPASGNGALGTDAVDLSTAAGAGSAITTIDAAISQVTSSLASVGSSTSRLESASTTNSRVAEQLAAAHSVLTDTDFAKAIAQLKSSEIQVKSASLLLGKDSLAQGKMFKALIK